MDYETKTVLHHWIRRCMDLAKTRANLGGYIDRNDIAAELVAILNDYGQYNKLPKFTPPPHRPK